MATIDELHATDYIEHGGAGQDTHGIQEYKQSMSEFYRAFPDVHATLDDIIVEGDRAAVRFALSFTIKMSLWASLRPIRR